MKYKQTQSQTAIDINKGQSKLGMCVCRSSRTVLKLVETSNLKANQCQKMGQKLLKCILFFRKKTESMITSFYQSVTKTQIQIYHLLVVLICNLKREEAKLLLLFSNHTPKQPVNTSCINSHLVFGHQLMKQSGQKNGHFFSKIPTVPICSVGPGLWQCW